MGLSQTRKVSRYLLFISSPVVKMEVGGGDREERGTKREGRGTKREGRGTKRELGRS